MLCEILKTNLYDRYKVLIEHMPIGCLLIGLDGEIIDINPKALEILGSPGVEETKKINMLTYPPLIDAGVDVIVLRSLSGESNIIDEIPYTSKWGKSAIIKFSSVPIYDETDSVCFSLTMMEDMTPYNKLKSDLQVANTLLKTVINSIPLLIWMKDKDGRYVHLNKAFNAFNAFVNSEVIGKTDYDIWPKDQAERLRDDDNFAMECDYPLELNEAILHPILGLRHYKTIKSRVCDEKNNVIGTVGISSDITKQYEQDIILAEAIETLTSSLDNNTYVK